MITKNSARYAEQFQGLYALLRGLGCSFFAGALYLGGWSASFHRDSSILRCSAAILLALGIAGSLIFAWAALLLKAKGAEKAWTRASFCSALCLFPVLFCSGFWLGFMLPVQLWNDAAAHSEYVLWASVCCALIAAATCLSAYREFTFHYTQTVWRDFSALCSFEAISSKSAKEDSE